VAARVLLILLGGVIYWLLTGYGVPRAVAIVIALGGFFWADRNGLVAGPIQPSGRDLMFRQDDGASASGEAEKRRERDR
jgi:hypothetical protein